MNLSKITFTSLMYNNPNVKSDTDFLKSQNNWHGANLNKQQYDLALSHVLHSFKEGLHDRFTPYFPQNVADNEIHTFWNLITVISKCFDDTKLYYHAKRTYSAFDPHVVADYNNRDLHDPQITPYNYMRLCDSLINNLKRALGNPSFDFESPFNSSEFFNAFFVVNFFNDTKTALYVRNLYRLVESKNKVVA